MLPRIAWPPWRLNSMKAEQDRMLEAYLPWGREAMLQEKQEVYWMVMMMEKRWK